MGVADIATPWASCARSLLGVLSPYLPALWSEATRTRPDRLAGTVVVLISDS
ncbi:MAG TPA: hypothetical protein VMB27_23740 [Solirubrobacteraceae bacterium]|nr:hypothetical protein [Solirubrobacteraceae bacterium]